MSKLTNLKGRKKYDECQIKNVRKNIYISAKIYVYIKNLSILILDTNIQRPIKFRVVKFKFD